MERTQPDQLGRSVDEVLAALHGVGQVQAEDYRGAARHGGAHRPQPGDGEFFPTWR